MPMSNEDHEKLIALTWRYAALVGILAHPERAVDENDLENDKRAHPELAGTDNGVPLFDCEAGIKFMMGESGLAENYCRAILCEQWPNEACSECGAPSQTTDCGPKTEGDKHHVHLKCVSCDHAEGRIVDCEDDFCEWCARLSAGLA